MRRKVVLLGPPASGKGTVAGRLEERLGMLHVSSGSLLRQEAVSGSGLGDSIAGALERGELVPDPEVLALMKRWVDGADLERGFLLDGFPRTLPQGQALDGWLAGRGSSLDAVLVFICRRETILDRVTGRRSCPTCGMTYHVRNMPPLVSGQCDRCQAELVQRDDDTVEVVSKRLEIFERETAPLAEHYRLAGCAMEVQADQDLETVMEEAADRLQA